MYRTLLQILWPVLKPLLVIFGVALLFGVLLGLLIAS